MRGVLASYHRRIQPRVGQQNNNIVIDREQATNQILIKSLFRNLGIEYKNSYFDMIQFITKNTTKPKDPFVNLTTLIECIRQHTQKNNIIQQATGSNKPSPPVMNIVENEVNNINGEDGFDNLIK